MTLQDVANRLDEAEQLCDQLPESDLRDAIVAMIGSAYRDLVSTSADLVQLLSDTQDQAREIRSIADSA